MMWCLLFAATGATVLLPMLPAVLEWLRPADVKPLHIDASDALDPRFAARTFVARLDEAVALERTAIGTVPLVTLGDPAIWPLSTVERRASASRRIWRSRAPLAMPSGTNFLAEVVSEAALRTAAGCVYRALWAGGPLRLAARTAVTHWAHGASVEVATGCRLAGAVSADERITVAGQASFRVLHASTVRFAGPAATPAGPPTGTPRGLAAGLPEPIVWDATTRRGISRTSVDIADFRHWNGDLVSHADLWLGTGCRAHGSLKAHGVLVADAACVVDGSIVAEGGIALGDGCVVGGSVISETAVVLNAGCVIGAPGRPATVSAPRIEVGPGVVVHGTLWAAEQGSVAARAGASVPVDAVTSADIPTRLRRSA